MARLPIRLGLLAMAVAGVGSFIGCGGVETPWNKAKSPHILVSFPPLYCFAANVEPNADVQVLMAHSDPHNYGEPTVQDAMMLRDANVFYINGLGLDENPAQHARRCAGTPKLDIVELGETIPGERVIKVNGQTDPHIWLGLPEASQMVLAIRDDLKKKYPNRSAELDKNASAYVDRLSKLLAEGREKLAAIPADKRKIVSFHDSMQYFARAFDIKVAAVLREIPDREPTPQDIANLVKICKEQQVRVILSEPEYSDGAAQALKNQLRQQGVNDVEVVRIMTLEKSPPEGLTPETYEKAMRENFETLAKALR